MDFDLPTIIVMILASIIGMAYVRHGKRTADIPFIVAGVSLFIYGYFVDTLVWSLVIGAALMAAPFAYRRFA